MLEDLVGVEFGQQIRTHIGHSFYLLTPSLDDIIRSFTRATQIIYPKDLGYITLKMGIREGLHVVEAGTGSGALTCVLALMVGESGRVYSYERRASRQKQARQNISRLGLDHRVAFIEQDIEEGFNQQNAHALFLDVPNPEDYLDQAWDALAGGGFFGAIVPTTNQLIKLLKQMYYGRWYMLQAEELILRPWKTIPARVRPDDRMVGHTGFLVFARAVYREVRERPLGEEDGEEFLDEGNEEDDG